jgi:hypothetical protein
MAVEAQNEIDRETQRRRVAEALEPPTQVTVESVRVIEPAAELPAGDATDNLPALIEPAEVAHRERGLIPVIPDVTRAATRWIRPFVPPIVASAIETTTRPLRGARQVFEETEEIHFSLRRSHRVSVLAEETVEPPVEDVRIEAATSTTARVDRPKRPPRKVIPKNSEPRQLTSGE